MFEVHMFCYVLLLCEMFHKTRELISCFVMDGQDVLVKMLMNPINVGIDRLFDPGNCISPSCSPVVSLSRHFCGDQGYLISF